MLPETVLDRIGWLVVVTDPFNKMDLQIDAICIWHGTFRQLPSSLPAMDNMTQLPFAVGEPKCVHLVVLSTWSPIEICRQCPISPFPYAVLAK